MVVFFNKKKNAGTCKSDPINSKRRTYLTMYLHASAPLHLYIILCGYALAN